VTRHQPLISIGLAAWTALSLSCQEASLDPRDVTAAETLWKANGLSSYRIELQVANGPVRRVEVTVENGSFRNGALRERSSNAEGWEPPIPLDETQARPYTVPGLFQTLREELSAGQRVVRATFNPNRGYVERIELSEIAGGTPTLIAVLSLEPL
jgi:hypothetical protein